MDDSTYNALVLAQLQKPDYNSQGDYDPSSYRSEMGDIYQAFPERLGPMEQLLGGPASTENEFWRSQKPRWFNPQALPPVQQLPDTDNRG